MAKAKFPIVRAKGTLPEIAPAARADIDVRMGGQSLWEALSDLGRTVTELSGQNYAKQGKIQADTAEMEARLSMVETMREIRAEDDVSKWKGLFEKHGQRVSGLTPKHKRGANQYNAAIKRLIPVWEEMFKRERERKLDDNMIASSMNKVSNLEKAATIDNMADVAKKIRTELILRDKLSFSISRTDTEILLANVNLEVQMSAAEKMALNEPHNILERIKGSKIKGFDAITGAQDVRHIGDMARRTIGLRLAGQRELREETINDEQGRLMQLARKGELTDTVIRDSQLDEFGVGSKSTFYGILDAQAEAALKNKEAPFKESDPRIEALVLDKIRAGKITQKEISDLVGKGLSIDDADRFISRRDFFKDPYFVRADRFLKDLLGWSDQLVKFVHPVGALSYHLAMNDLFDAIETEKLEGRDILDRAAQVSERYVQDYMRKVWTISPEEMQEIITILRTGTMPEEGTPPKKAKTVTEKELDEIWK